MFFFGQLKEDLWVPQVWVQPPPWIRVSLVVLLGSIYFQSQLLPKFSLQWSMQWKITNKQSSMQRCFAYKFHVLKLDGVDGLCDLHCLCGVLEVLQDRPHSKYGYAMLRPPCVAQPDFWVSKVLGFKAITHRFRTWVFEECQNDPVFNFGVPRARWEFFSRIVSLLFIYIYIYSQFVTCTHRTPSGSLF